MTNTQYLPANHLLFAIYRPKDSKYSTMSLPIIGYKAEDDNVWPLVMTRDGAVHVMWDAALTKGHYESPFVSPTKEQP